MALRFGNSGVRFGAGRPARLGGTPPARAGLGKLLLGVPGTFLCGFPKGREAAMAKAEQRAENLESGKNFEQSHLTNHIPDVMGSEIEKKIPAPRRVFPLSGTQRQPSTHGRMEQESAGVSNHPNRGYPA